MNTKMFAVTAIVAAAVLGCVAFAGGASGFRSATAEVLQSSEGFGDATRPFLHANFPSLMGATDWINSPPLTNTGLRGKVVLVEFWTYTCVNWRRESPYVRAWAQRYRDKGLVVIGVHSPEFDFEKDADNVRRATKEIGIDYPVAVDSRMGVWTAFGNEYWPALYFIDAKGRVRGRHFGEGDYDQSEQMIRALLTEAGATDLGNDLTAVEPKGAEVAGDAATLRSPESYVGSARENDFASPGGLVLYEPHSYVVPERMHLNQWALAGEWMVRHESIVSGRQPTRLVYSFHARDVNLVMGPAAPGLAPRFQVLIDGKAPGAARGADVDEAGGGAVSEPRLYQLIRQRGEIKDHLFEIDFLDPGAEAFDFTFG
jgi:thiol-disulfide isomerase/thioredoxin